MMYPVAEEFYEKITDAIYKVSLLFRAIRKTVANHILYP